MADLRFERTEKMIQLNFLKLLETTSLNDISIARLAKASMIDRSTFYAHYDNVFELAEQLIDDNLAYFSKAFEQSVQKRKWEKNFDSYSFFTEELVTYLTHNRHEIQLLRSLNLGINSFDQKLRRLFSQVYAQLLDLSTTDFIIFLLVNMALSDFEFVLENQRVPSKTELKNGLQKIVEFLG